MNHAKYNDTYNAIEKGDITDSEAGIQTGRILGKGERISIPVNIMKMTLADGMTKITRKSKIYLVVVSALFTTEIAEAKMDSTDIWSFIENTRSAIENVTTQSIDLLPLPATLISENEYVSFYKGKDVTLSDSSKIMDIDLRLSKVSDGMAPFFSFSYSGHCLVLDDIRKRYGELTLSDYPTGRSENEMTSYTTSANKKGPNTTFSFTEKEPGCLNKAIISAE